jgi:hypothetical protein
MVKIALIIQAIPILAGGDVVYFVISVVSQVVTFVVAVVAFVVAVVTFVVAVVAFLSAASNPTIPRPKADPKSLKHYE